jgi:hypothetical protein
MAYKIANQSIQGRRPPSPEDLKRKFETAVCELYRADFAAKKRLRTDPIVPRRGILGVSQDAVEKQAVSDAARALAELWKV